MLWEVFGQPVQSSQIGNLEPREVLYEFDGPKLYVSLVEGKALLVYESATDDQQELVRLIAAPTSSAIITSLKDGRRSVFEALNQPWVFAINQAYDAKLVDAWLLEDGIASVPTNARPKETTLLWPHLADRTNPYLISELDEPQIHRYRIGRRTFTDSITQLNVKFERIVNRLSPSEEMYSSGVHDISIAKKPISQELPQRMSHADRELLNVHEVSLSNKAAAAGAAIFIEAKRNVSIAAKSVFGKQTH